MIANYPDRPYVIAGDFNQPIADPPARGSERHDAMADLLDGLDTPTIGVPPGWEREENDHIVTGSLNTLRVQGWPNVIDGVRCTDHAGVLIDVTLP